MTRTAEHLKTDITSVRRRRHRRFTAGALTGIAAKIGGQILGLVLVRVVARYLGPEQYGLWVTVITLTYLMQFADLGMGNGLLNFLSAAYARDDRASARTGISTAFFALGGVSALGAAVLFFVIRFLPVDHLLHFTSQASADLVRPACLAVLCFVAVSVPLSVVQRTQIAFQETHAANAWQFAGQVFSFGAVLVATRYRADVAILIAVWLGAQAAVAGANWVIHYGSTRRWLFPTPKAFDASLCRSLLRTGAVFVILQTVGQLIVFSDNIILGRTANAAAIGPYAIALRAFAAIPGIVSMVVAPLWPAYREAAERDDHVWIRQTLKRSILYVALGGTLCCLPIIVGRSWIFSHWVGREYIPTLSLCLACAAWAVTQGIGTTVAMFLNGCGWYVLEACFAIVTLVLTIPAKVHFFHTYGPTGLLWSATAIYVACNLASLIPIRNRLLRGRSA